MCKETEIKKFIQCRNCPNINNGGPQPGYYYTTINGNTFVKECSCHARWREEQNLAITLKNSQINPDYTFDNYVGTKSLVDMQCLRKIANNPDKFIYKKMIYLWGPNSTQKTSMVQALGKELIIKGYSVQYELMSDLLMCLVNDFNRSEDSIDRKNYVLERCNNCDFLIIDEAFDLKKSTIYASGYQIPYLDTFLRNRFEINKKSIIFVSNRAPSQISEVPTARPNEVTKEGFGTNLQSFVERNVKQSTLVFKDVWIDNVNAIDSRGLFR